MTPCYQKNNSIQQPIEMRHKDINLMNRNLCTSEFNCGFYGEIAAIKVKHKKEFELKLTIGFCSSTLNEGEKNREYSFRLRKVKLRLHLLNGRIDINYEDDISGRFAVKYDVKTYDESTSLVKVDKQSHAELGTKQVKLGLDDSEQYQQGDKQSTSREEIRWQVEANLVGLKKPEWVFHSRDGLTGKMTSRNLAYVFSADNILDYKVSMYVPGLSAIEIETLPKTLIGKIPVVERLITQRLKKNILEQIRRQNNHGSKI